MCDEVLAEADIARREVTIIAAERGPDAFTGVRLAVSTTEGIAMVPDISVVPVSTLAAPALAAPDNGVAILSVIDARTGEIYVGRSRRAADGLVDVIGPEQVGYSGHGKPARR